MSVPVIGAYIYRQIKQQRLAAKQRHRTKTNRNRQNGELKTSPANTLNGCVLRREANSNLYVVS